MAVRIGADSGTSTGKTQVCRAFQDLVKANGWSAFVVRCPSFTAAGLDVLQKSQRDQVRMCTYDDPAVAFLGFSGANP